MEHDDQLTSAIADAASPLERRGAAVPERRCILTGAHGPRAALIRLVAGADGQVAVDLSARLPGRGAWIAADRRLLETALAKGRLKGALARAFKSNSLRLDAELPDRIAAGLERRALDRLGLENRSGNLIWGHERVGEALLKGRVRLLLHAADARPDGMSKLEARRRGASPDTVSIVLPVGREQLSMALGRENVVHAAVCDAASASRVIEALERWAAFTGTKVRDADAAGEMTAMAPAVADDDELTGPALADPGDERH
jgi:predicted RNA-binding protein YlxR (DUF448 family)/ribosomal protein L7Ae-like RNA K-turn-binding protein